MISKSIDDTNAIAKQFAERLEPNDFGATVIALSGDLGSGKTTFTKAFGSFFGISEENITSPTFVIEKRFTLTHSAHFKQLIHIDAYRLESAQEIERLDWVKTISEKTNIILIEWPEKIGKALPQNALRISFSHMNGAFRDTSNGVSNNEIDENTREIVFN